MPHKQKKHPNVFKDGSPRAEMKHSVPEPPPFAPPIPATTNYREIHQNEVEALRSIYGDDFEDVEHRRSAWQVWMPIVGFQVYANKRDTSNRRTSRLSSTCEPLPILRSMSCC